MNPVGYLIKTDTEIKGECGSFYNYVVAGNGLFVEASGSLLRTTVRIAEASIRGLPFLQEEVQLVQGKIPGYIYDLAISALYANHLQETYLAVTWDGRYQLHSPLQMPGDYKVQYSRLSSTILDIHSHGEAAAFFSYTDDKDEQGFQIYMVVGKLDSLVPEIKLRVGVYGYFMPVNVNEVFDV